MSDERDYYDLAGNDPRGMRYRLDGSDVIENAVDSLKGGFKLEAGKKVYYEHRRLMNEEGISRVEFFLKGACNKISHLTKYKNEDRIMMQIRELAHAFLIELVLNMKIWAANAETHTVEEERELMLPNGEVIKKTIKYDYLVNPENQRVKNPYLVLQVVENAMLSSMQRGVNGFEATNLGKVWSVNESIGAPPGDGAPEQKQGFFKWLGGGR